MYVLIVHGCLLGMNTLPEIRSGCPYDTIFRQNVRAVLAVTVGSLAVGGETEVVECEDEGTD